MARYRKNGFQSPMSSYQKKAILFYPILTFLYYLMIILIEKSIKKIVILFLVHFFLFLIVVISWYWVERIDPVEVKGEVAPKVLCFKSSKVTTRYCGTCHKSVEGIDHHCLWLNTCIGSKNYLHFFLLVLFGFFQTSLQIAVGVLYLTEWYTSTIHSFIFSSLSVNWIYTLLISLQCAFAGVICVGFGTLLVFHMYLLLWARMGTYEWLLARGDPSKGDDSYSEVQQKYLANEAKRFEREKEWAQTLAKSRTPTHNKQLSMSAIDTKSLPPTPQLIQFEPFTPQNLELLNQLSSEGTTFQPNLNDSMTNPSINTKDLLNETTTTELELNRQTDDTIGGRYSSLQAVDGVQCSPTGNQLQTDSNKTNQTVFRSLYLKAAQVFPLSNSPSFKHSKSSHGGNVSELAPHPELSYHSIISHHDSSRYDTGYENQHTGV